MNTFFMDWVKTHITECGKVTERKVEEYTFYEYHATTDDREYAENCYDSVGDYMVSDVTDTLCDIFRKRNPVYERDNLNTDITEEILWAVGELESMGALYVVTESEKEPLKVVTEYRGDDRETYVIVKDERGFAAINKTDIQDGKVTRAYTGAEACASDTAAETLKILRGRIYMNGLKEQGFPEMEILKKSVEWWKNN